MVTTDDMYISTNNPLISVNDRHADRHELTASTTLELANGSQLYRDQHTDDQFSIGRHHSQLSCANLPVVTDIRHTTYAAKCNSQMNLPQANNVPVHHMDIVVLASEIMPNPQTIKVLNTDVVNFSTSTVYGTDDSNELKISQNLLLIRWSITKI